MMHSPKLMQRAFTAVPLVVLLAVTMVTLGLVIAFKAPAKATASGAYNSGYQTGLFVGPIVIGAFFVWLASRIAEKRSQGLATAICGTILLLANIAYGVNALRAIGVIKPLPPKQVTSSGMAANTLPSNLGKVANTPSSADGSLDSPPEVPSQGVRVQPQPQPTGASSTTPSDSQPKREEPVRRAPVPALAPPKDAATNEAGSKALATLRAEVIDSVLAIAQRGEGAYARMRKPVTTKSALDKAMEEFATLKVDAEKMEKRLRNLSQEARDVLVNAGVDQFDTMRMAMEWERGMATFDCVNACGTLGRAGDTAQEFVVILNDTLGKWKVDAAGKVTSPDRNGDDRIFGPRAQMGFALDRQVETLNALKQGDVVPPKSK